MAALDNTRWELFAIGLASGKSQLKAYLDAGFNASSSGNASNLAKRPEVKARVAELVEDRTKFNQTFVEDETSEETSVIDRAVAEGRADRGWIIKQLMTNVTESRAAMQFSASNQALKILVDLDKTAPGDDSERLAEQRTPVSVDQVNKLLSAIGYDGPALALKPKTPTPVAAVDHDHAS
jgi:hypothetical protein